LSAGGQREEQKNGKKRKGFHNFTPDEQRIGPERRDSKI
jgi:hypothetical protein